MTGGQKTNINLESSLDIKTSDMLVPVSQQTFQHNWQKYQGKFLPNSLRFEKNGWAAGWCVYNFDYSAHLSRFFRYAHPAQRQHLRQRRVLLGDQVLPEF